MLAKFFSRKKKISIPEDEYELVYNYLRELIPKNHRSVELQPETKLLELGIDSIKYMNLIVKLEEIVNKDLADIIKDIDILTIQTIEDVVNLIKKLRQDAL